LGEKEREWQKKVTFSSAQEVVVSEHLRKDQRGPHACYNGENEKETNIVEHNCT